MILRAEQVTKSKGGIVLPENTKKVCRGTVVAVGPGSRNANGDFVPMQVKVGDSVLLPEYGGTKVELEENKEYAIFKESDLLAKLEN